MSRDTDSGRDARTNSIVLLPDCRLLLEDFVSLRAHDKGCTPITHISGPHSLVLQDGLPLLGEHAQLLIVRLEECLHAL